MKKLIPAICMTLIAAFMLASSTFAWFSMNTTVTATDMEVVAKSDNTYLLISSTKTSAPEIQGENKTTVSLVPENSKVYPCAPAISEDEVGYLATGKPIVGSSETITIPGVAVTNADTAREYTNWYTATAKDPTASTIKEGSAQQLKSFEGYVIKETVYLTVAAGANAANNLSVTATINQKAGGNDLSAARILVATSDNGFAILKSGELTATIGTSNITSSTVVTVDIYIYIDGNDSQVYTNNALSMKGVNISLAFNVKAVAAGA